MRRRSIKLSPPSLLLPMPFALRSSASFTRCSSSSCRFFSRSASCIFACRPLSAIALRSRARSSLASCSCWRFWYSSSFPSELKKFPTKTFRIVLVAEPLRTGSEGEPAVAPFVSPSELLSVLLRNSAAALASSTVSSLSSSPGTAKKSKGFVP